MMKTVTIVREHLCDFVGEIGPLLRLHHVELTGRDESELDPDWDQYLAQEQAKAFVAHVARDDGDQIAGYAGFFIVPDFHRKGHLIAKNDVFYVRQERRGGYLGKRMVSHCERDMRARGADRIVWEARAGTMFEKLLSLLGYSKQGNLWTKNLKE